MVIKSTVPVGYTAKLQARYPELEISPRSFSRRAGPLDNLYPRRSSGAARSGAAFRRVVAARRLEPDVPVLVTDSMEAIKLFANTYLAMRVAFFNELDSYAMTHGLDTRSIIEGVCLDPRVGQGYNNPSLVMGAIAYRRIRGSFWLTIAMCPEPHSRHCGVEYHSRTWWPATFYGATPRP